jgi:hypothetical protein
MYSCDDAGERISVVQLNSELRHAQLELVSAHCAAHQLRLRYSLDDLARLGHRDLLRKSADAASALHEFYQHIDQRLPKIQGQGELFPRITAEQAAQAAQWTAAYLRQQREHYFPAARPLDVAVKFAIAAYFPAGLLERVRVVELHGERVAPPEFLAEARALGFENLPDIPHMESLTFLDVIAFNEKLSERAIFHALVHTLQIQILGLERYAELWVRGFLKSKAHFTVPLEVHAFSLASKFLKPGGEKFSVEDQVLHWAAADLY